jgi:uncharacterized protein YbjT (DUF2867 family)
MPMRRDTDRYLVTGAGVTGGEVLRCLANARRPARALVRSVASAESFQKLGIELVEGDFGQRDSWARALDGIAAVFNITVPHPAAVDWNASFLECARQSGVAHVVQLSGMNVSPSSTTAFHRQMSQCDEALKASGLAYTILQPNVFHQNMLRMSEPIRTQGRFRSAVGDAQISMIDVRDIAEVAIKALAEDGHARKVYVLTGPEPITYFDVARFLSRAVGKPIEYEAIEEEQAVGQMVRSGLPEAVARSRVGVHRSFSSGAFARVTSDVQQVLHRTPRSFSEFANDHAAAFR